MYGRLPVWAEALLLDHASLGWGGVRTKTLVFETIDDTLWFADVEPLEEA